jgi:hypothetical protein
VNPKIELTRGVFLVDLLWEWYQEMAEDDLPVGRTILIQAYENIQGPSATAPGTSKGRRTAQPLYTWILEEALPIKWSGLTFDASKIEGQIRLMHSMTFICRRILHGLVDPKTATGDVADGTQAKSSAGAGAGLGVAANLGGGLGGGLGGALSGAAGAASNLASAASGALSAAESGALNAGGGLNAKISF